MAPGGVVHHARHVVGDQEAAEADLVQRPHHGEGVDVALVDKALVEAGHLALHVAEVDVDDAPAGAEVTHRVQHSRRPHLRPAAHAEVEAVTRAVEGVDGALEAGEVAKDARHAAERRNRRVIGMQRQGDARLLRHRQDAAQVVLVVVPQLPLPEFAPMRERSVGVLGQVEAGGPGAAAQRRQRGRPPHLVGHPVIAEYRDAGAAHVADGGLHVRNLLVAPRQAEHRLVVEAHRDVLQAHEAQLGGVGALPQRQQVRVLPPLLPRQLGRVHQKVVRPKLLDRGQLLIRKLAELPEPNPHLIPSPHHNLLLPNTRPA